MYKLWKEYLDTFESTILISLFENNEYSIKYEPVPLRAGKLHKTSFGDFVGKSFGYPRILSFNYYGLFKVSTGLINANKVKQGTTIKSPVIHFSSVKIEYIEKYHKDLLLDFVSFKKFLVNLRWNEN